MAKAESKTILKAYSTVESKLPTLPLEDGQLIFVYDKKKIILDNHGVRTVYEQIQTIETEEQRNDLLAPIDSFYFVIETSILWRYSNGHWNQITTSPQEQIDKIVAEGTKQVKAVRDEGQKVLQSIPEDFATQMETKLNKQQGIENKGKVLVIEEDGNVVPGEVASGGGDGIAIINTMSGESPLVIPDSAERVNKGLELGGKTEQVQTTGAQLLPFPYATGDMTKNGVTFAVQEDGGIKVTGTATEFVIFNIAKIDFGANSIFNNSAGNGKVLSGGKDNVKIEYHGLNKNTYLSIGKGLTVNTVIYPQLQNGTAATPYEPYTGGKPSPSPEYPQEIKNSGKWNEETQKYEVDVKVTGKNLFDMNKFIDTCNFTKNEDGTFIIDKHVERYDCFIPANTILSIEVLKVEDSSGAAALELFYEDGKSMYIGFGQVGVKTFLIQKDVVYIKVLAYRKHEYKYIQLEKGNTATPYEPYKEQTLTITSDRPITKFDKLVEQDGKIGWLYKSKIDTLPKTGYGIRGTDGNKYGVYFGKTGIFKDAITTSGCAEKDSNFFTHFKLGNPYSSNGDIAWLYVNKPGITDLRVRFADESINTVELFEKYMADKDIKILYETAQTEFVPLQQSEQNAIRALKTYYPTTVITVDGGEVDPDIKVTYTADTKNYVDNKFGKTINAMQTKLLELESRV